MTHQEMVQVLKGPREGKLVLLESMTQRVLQGEALEEGEISIFETLKKELLSAESRVVSMQASVVAVAGMGG